MKTHKKVVLIIVAIFWTVAVTAQDSSYRVDTSAQKKGVVLEVFTGYTCGPCLDGDKVSADLQRYVYPNDLFVIDYHAGFKAVPSGNGPDYRTPEGEHFDTMFNDFAYPTAAVNRRYFEEQDFYNAGVVGMLRGGWRKSCKQIHSDETPVNLWVGATLDSATRLLTVTVEAYRRTSYGENPYLLNVALLQDHVLGPQSGYSGSDYSHDNMFRAFLQPKDWDTLHFSSGNGNFITKTYTYTVPADYRAINVDLSDLRVVAFVSGGSAQQVKNGLGQPIEVREIQHAAGAKPVLSGFANERSLATIYELADMSSRYADNFFSMLVRNLGSDTVRTLSFDVNINGNSQEANWDGIIPPYSDASIVVTVNEYELLVSDNRVSFSISKVNGVVRNTAVKTFPTFSGSVNVVGSNTLCMRFSTDYWGDEVSWEMRDRDGNVAYKSSPYPAAQQTTVYDTFVFLNGGIYTFHLYDYLGDGLLVNPKGQYRFSSGTGTFLLQNLEITDHGLTIVFNMDTVETPPIAGVGVLQSASAPKITLIPNPAQDEVTLSVENVSQRTPATIEILSVSGKIMQKSEKILSTSKNSIPLRISQLSGGVYFIKITTKDGTSVQKLIKQ
ncbi:MAG: Omp28-related outer membrane protein [Bacteroidales bacterium]|jgi:hypothetical protein|nr:Omp28-related outer membrane protein [Bacteroidales bacterium]